jgi:aspartate-semialdehyde dehydrogenase|tara:strand:- start:111 stop:293 length:183 start_codon:yes stop_codon:yes gene_type:complete
MEDIKEEQKELLRTTLTSLVKINNEVIPLIDEKQNNLMIEETEKISDSIHKLLKMIKNGK